MEPYKMKSGSTRTALIINIRASPQGPRDFSNRDAMKLTSALRQYGFKVEQENDLTKSQIIEKLKRLSKVDYSEQDCFVCCILSTGDYGIIYGTDEPVQTEQFLEFFKGDTCRTLAGKPKIFIFQACNHIMYMKETTDSETSTDSNKNAYTIPSEADFLMVWSLVPGTLTNANNEGSSFISSFCDRLQESQGKMEINRILTGALRDTNKKLEKQVPNAFRKANYRLPCVVNMLTRPLVLPLEH